MATKNGYKGRPRKRITPKEKEFADLMIDSGLGAIEAARKVFQWKCEPKSSESIRAVNLSKAERIKLYMDKRAEQIVRETEAHKLFMDADELQWDEIRKFAYKRLQVIRDDSQQPARTRFNAIKSIEKLSDPSSDSGLINMWLAVIWRGLVAHCPCCHNNFPMWKIQNTNTKMFFEEEPLVPTFDILERRTEILKRADRRKRPHPGQVKALEAPERHLAGMGAARAGKSVLLAWLALLHFLIPGVEIWILARVYEDARSEVDYLRNFLKTLFYPYENKLIKEYNDSKTGELVMTSKWGSELKIRSAKAKGSITGRELEAAFVAEPGWVDESIYNHLLARMSSRLGRIIMFGTPQGFGGILGKFLYATGRNEQGIITRIRPEDRTIDKVPWGFSLLSYHLSPEQNPEYVKSELDMARQQLSDSEYASEFEGLMSTEDGAKFPQVQARHLIDVGPNIYSDCVFVLGIDQGPKNFAATLLGFDGKNVFVARDYFESDMNTMMWHMKNLKRQVPLWISNLGGQDMSWKLTIFDADPLVHNELYEMEGQGNPWPTEVTFRPKGTSGQLNQTNWRKETYEFVNVLASPEKPNLMFDMQYSQLLHDQVMRVQNKPENPDSDSGSPNAKGWIVSDAFRGDHVLDSLMLALWTIRTSALMVSQSGSNIEKDPWLEAKNAFRYNVRKAEQKELSGYISKDHSEEDVFHEEFGRSRGKASWTPKNWSPYRDY
jgi:hypothetical protein